MHEYLQNVGDVRRGRLAAIVLNHMADYWAVDDTSLTVRELRILLQRASPHFSIIRDLADASKHVQLSRDDRVLSEEGQLSRPPGLFQAPFGVGVFAEASLPTVTLDDGRKVALEDVVRSVMSMWEEKLRTLRCR